MLEKQPYCDHACTSNCRREGCNCLCGEWHCDLCNGTGIVEIMGGSSTDEWTVVKEERCPCRE
jgi:hypothetical protein